MKISRTNEGYATSWRDQAWLQAELEIQERAHQENRIRNLEEVEEFKQICCPDAERAQELRTDEFSRQELQYIFQIQGLSEISE